MPEKKEDSEKKFTESSIKRDGWKRTPPCSNENVSRIRFKAEKKKRGSSGGLFGWFSPSYKTSVTAQLRLSSRTPCQDFSPFGRSLPLLKKSPFVSIILVVEEQKQYGLLPSSRESPKGGKAIE